MLNQHASRIACALAGVGAFGLFGISVDAVAADWKPSKKVGLIAHVRTSSSTYAFASAVFNKIKKQKLVPKGIALRAIRGARGGSATC